MGESQPTAGRAIHRGTGKTFFYATRLLPERVREPTYVLYGFFRIADEVVDGDEYEDPTASEPATDHRHRRLLQLAHTPRCRADP